MRHFLVGAIALVWCAGCIAGEPSPGSAAAPSTSSTPAKKPNDSGASLRAAADGGAPYSFVIAPLKDRTREYALNVTPPSGNAPIRLRDGKLAEFPLAFKTRQNDVPVNPVAMLSKQDSATPAMQRVYIVFAGDVDTGPSACVGEFVVHMDRLASGRDDIVLDGRMFALPVVGSFAGTTVALGNKGESLVVKVPAPAGDASQPVLLTYDIRATSDSREPVNILMIPRVDGATP